jgi:hypothetical protein
MRKSNSGFAFKDLDYNANRAENGFYNFCLGGKGYQMGAIREITNIGCF